jgi:ribose/xylose/arabinose/galactoside ABC-type transport system permease subunit
MVGVNPYVQNVIKVGIILLAIYLSRDRRKVTFSTHSFFGRTMQ